MAFVAAARPVPPKERLLLVADLEDEKCCRAVENCVRRTVGFEGLLSRSVVAMALSDFLPNGDDIPSASASAGVFPPTSPSPQSASPAAPPSSAAAPYLEGVQRTSIPELIAACTASAQSFHAFTAALLFSSAKFELLLPQLLQMGGGGAAAALKSGRGDAVSFLPFLFDLLSPGASLSLHLVASAREKGEELRRLLERGCLYSGFVTASDVVLEDIPLPAGSVVVRGTFGKPGWELGATATTSLIADGGGLVDEEALLKDEDAAMSNYSAMGKGKESCASKPRACANCSCGRKELEEELGAQEAKKRLENGTVRSSCGSCYLGDAFRCATCPYLGMPAFKPGEKLELDVAKSNLGGSTALLSKDRPAMAADRGVSAERLGGAASAAVGSVVKVVL